MTFYLFLRIPLAGVLIYGIAEASTAYLITKITEPPPDPKNREQVEDFKKRDVKWENKHEFLNVPLEAMDTLHGRAKRRHAEKNGEIKGRQFT